jgi:hypothetical protein
MGWACCTHRSRDEICFARGAEWARPPGRLERGMENIMKMVIREGWAVVDWIRLPPDTDH